MHLWAVKQSYIRKTVSNVRGDTIYNQAPNIIATKTKQSTICMSKQEKQKFKMDAIWLKAYCTSHRTRSTTVNSRIKQRAKPKELKCNGKRRTRRLISNTCPNTNTILHAYISIPWIILLFTVIIVHICHGNVMAYEVTARTTKPMSINSHITTNYRAKRSTQYSQLLSNDGRLVDTDINNSFQPIIPQDISREFIAQNVFTKTGQYRVFQPPTSDLREAMTMEQRVDKISMIQNNASNTRGIGEMESKSTKKTNKRTKVAENKITGSVIDSSTTQEDVIKTTSSLSDSVKEKSPFEIEKSIKKLDNITNMHTSTAFAANAENRSRAITNVFTPNNQPAFEQIKEQKYSILNFKPMPTSKPPTTNTEAAHNIDMKEIETLLIEYAESFFNQAQYEPSNELINALQKNHTTADGLAVVVGPYKKRPTRHANANPHHHHQYHHHYHHEQLYHNLPSPAITRKADGDINLNIPRAMESGRLLFSTGLKKMLWPIFMGLQVLKSLLFALFLPTLIGSFGKLLGKGIVSGSAPLFIRPADVPQDLDFRDNTINFDDDKFAAVDEGTKENGYAYHQAEASQTHYTYNTGGINRIEQQTKMPDTYLSALQTIGSASFKNSGSLSGSSSNGGLGGGGLGAPLRTKPAAPANTNNFQTFQKVPASSLLLSNYDPFYSPLLSRLDSVFAQLKLNSDNENCREKLICLMYANPAKYAPYSNLVSAQLSRELNELRKPTSDNPDILRFFKYMRAAKDGQDGVDCEKTFDGCKEFKDFENPAMVSTYHDINKLVQARKLA